MMFVRSPDAAFRRFKRTGDPAALAAVFDRCAPELMKLARHLAGDEPGAEDLLQATFVTAIESAADHDDARPVLPWLVGVLGNHARAARRQARRVVDPTRLAMREATEPSAAAQSRELRAEVDAAIADLPDAYRPVLRLYLQDGLEPIEIARRLERPPGTVRAQVSRGLDALRRALPVGLARVASAAAPVAGRGLDAVRSAVLGECGARVATGGLVAVSTGVVALMNKKLALSVVGLAAAGLLGTLAYGVLTRPSPGESPRVPPAARGSVAAVPNGDVEPGAAARSALDEAVVPAAEPAEATHGSIRVRVVRERDQQPAVGIGVTCQPYRFDVVPHFAARYPVVRTDAAGVAVFERLALRQYRVDLDRSSMAAGQVVQVDAAREYAASLAVPVGLSVRGVIRDPDGQPVGGALLMVNDTRGLSHRVTTSDARGVYRCEDIADGLELQARAAGFAPSSSHPLRGKPGSERELDLQLLAAGRRVVGMVRDAAGQPVADALVVFAPRSVIDQQRIDPTRPWRRSPFLFTDAAGRFASDEVAAGEEHVVAACAASRPDDAFAVAELAAGPADAFVDLRLRRGATIEGRAHEGGEPIPLTTVIAWPERPADDIGYLLNLFGLKQVICGDDGGYRLTGIAPGDYHLQALRGPRFAERRSTIVEGDRIAWNPERGGGAKLRLRLSPGRIALRNGERFYGWQVLVMRRSDKGGHELASSGTANPDGRLEITGLVAGSYDVVVKCQLDRFARSSVLVARRDDVRTGPDEIVWEIPENALPSAQILGRVLDASGRPVADARVVAVRISDVMAASAQTVTGADGTFSIGPLTAGTYGVRIEGGERPTFLGQHEVFAGQNEDLGDVRQQ